MEEPMPDSPWPQRGHRRNARPASRSPLGVLARNASWQAELELDANAARILNCTNGSTGNYTELQGLLIVDWDHWPLEIFEETNDIYRAVFAARRSSSISQVRVR
jgi:hypothetical protein